MLRVDLAAAGIEYRDASDRVADFHSLRHTYVTRLAKSNAPVKVMQDLARHSTPTLTLGNYAHVGVTDRTRALDALPAIDVPETEREAVRATGTHGATADMTATAWRNAAQTGDAGHAKGDGVRDRKGRVERPERAKRRKLARAGKWHTTASGVLTPCVRWLRP
jgi:hypothetical protein